MEAGGKDRSPNIKIPAAFPNQFHTKLDWDYCTEPEPYVDGRSLYVPRGKSLGGSSSMNAMLYVRGRPLDYAQLGVRRRDGLGLGRRAAVLHALRGQRARRLGVPRRRRRAARRGAALPALDEPPAARGQRGGGDPAHRGLQRARAGRRGDVPGHAAQRPALEHGRRVPASGPEALEPRGGDGRAGRGPAARGRAGARDPHPGAPRARAGAGGRARGHPGRRRDRLSPAPDAVGHRAGRPPARGRGRRSATTSPASAATSRTTRS